MNLVKSISEEEDVTSLKPGEKIMINGNPFTFRQVTPDGGEYVRPISEGTIELLRVRGYHIINNQMNPVWYSQRTVSLTDRRRQQ